MTTNRLKQILEDKGIKQSWLAKQVGINKSTLGNIINNRYSTSVQIALKIAKVLEMKVEDIWDVE